MDPIGISQPVIVPVQTQPTLPAPGSSAQILPDPASAGNPLPGAGAGQVSFDAQAAEQTRVAQIQNLAQQIANVYVIGDQTFSLFKDMTGQYITRFTSLKDGKVTYIPEPTLFKLGGGNTAPVIKIQA